MSDARDRNQAAYRVLRDTIDRSYPPGRYVAIAAGSVVADADSFPGLQDVLRSQGRDSDEVLVVQAGGEYPEEVVIFL